LAPDQYSSLLFYLDFAGARHCTAPCYHRIKRLAGHAGPPLSAGRRKTTLASRRHVGPLTVQRPFYPEEETCHLYLLHPPGGIVGGDELTISATIDPGCHTLITMPGASKFYRSSGAQARLQQTLTLAENSTLEWLPQDAIFFPGANAALSTAFHLPPPARCWRGICCALAAR
jgi:urease accessory protein UreH